MNKCELFVKPDTTIKINENGAEKYNMELIVKLYYYHYNKNREHGNDPVIAHQNVLDLFNVIRGSKGITFVKILQDFGAYTNEDMDLEGISRQTCSNIRQKLIRLRLHSEKVIEFTPVNPKRGQKPSVYLASWATEEQIEQAIVRFNERQAEVVHMKLKAYDHEVEGIINIVFDRVEKYGDRINRNIILKAVREQGLEGNDVPVLADRVIEEIHIRGEKKVWL